MNGDLDLCAAIRKPPSQRTLQHLTGRKRHGYETSAASGCALVHLAHH